MHEGKSRCISPPKRERERKAQCFFRRKLKYLNNSEATVLPGWHPLALCAALIKKERMETTIEKAGKGHVLMREWLIYEKTTDTRQEATLYRKRGKRPEGAGED